MILSLLAAAALQQGISTRDSAGIQIVTVQARALSALPRWTLDTLLLEIGRDREEPEYQLHMAASPWRLSDGRIAVANQQYEIRFYDSGGRHVRTIGRRGQGPGEYQQLWNILPVAGDSLLVLDIVLGISMLDPAGRRVSGSDWTASSPDLPIVLLPDATVLHADRTAWQQRFLQRHGTRHTGIYRDTALIVRADRNGQPADTLDTLPGTWWHSNGGFFSGLSLSSSVFLAARGETVVAGDGARFDIRWYDVHSGALRRITRVTFRQSRGTQALADRELAFEMRRFRRPIRQEGPPVPVRFAEYLPMIELARVDAQGTAWIRRWTIPDEPEAEWIVFDRTGRPAARISMPSGLRVSQIESDFVLGIFRDPDGVDSIRRYRLRRTP